MNNQRVNRSRNGIKNTANNQFSTFISSFRFNIAKVGTTEVYELADDTKCRPNVGSRGRCKSSGRTTGAVEESAAHTHTDMRVMDGRDGGVMMVTT